MQETKTFFEYLGNSNLELVHSQMIKWILSEDFQGFKNREKSVAAILHRFFEIEDPLPIRSISTEQNSIDICIELPNTTLYIENKIKSSQHSDQLKRYKDKVEHDNPDRNQRFYFLTLFGEQAATPGWINKSYQDLEKVLKSLVEKGEIEGNFNGDLLKEYIKTLENFSTAIKEFLEKPGDHPLVFINAGRKKANKTAKPNNNTEKFIARNNLETLFQKVYFREVFKHINFHSPHYYITESQGQAMLGCILIPLKKMSNNLEFNFAMDFQNGTFKTFCVAGDYINSSKSDLPAGVKDLFDLIQSNHPQYGYKKVANPSKTKALCSITKKINLNQLESMAHPEVEYWWQLRPEIFAAYYRKEMEISQEIFDHHILPALKCGKGGLR